MEFHKKMSSCGFKVEDGYIKPLESLVRYIKYFHPEGHKGQKIIKFLLIFLLLLIWISGNAAADSSNLTIGGWNNIGPEATYIDINSIPSGAQIWINGENTNQITPDRVVFGERINYNLWLILDGYETYEESLDVSALAGNTITRTLSPKMASIGDFSDTVYGRRGGVIRITPIPTTPTPQPTPTHHTPTQERTTSTPQPTPTTHTPEPVAPTSPTPTSITATPTPHTPTPEPTTSTPQPTPTTHTPEPAAPTSPTPTSITATPTPHTPTPEPTTPTATTPTPKTVITTAPKPATAQMLFQIRSIPAGAQIWIDGGFTGKLTPDKIYFDRFESHTYELRLNGYQPYQENIYISDSITKEVTLIPLQTTEPSIFSYIIELIRRVFAFQS